MIDTPSLYRVTDGEHGDVYLYAADPTDAILASQEHGHVWNAVTVRGVPSGDIPCNIKSLNNLEGENV